LWSERALSRFGQLVRVDRAQAEARLRRHVGVCLDACHAAVEFEPALSTFRTLRAEGIAVPKIQVSAGLALPADDARAREALAEFADDVYLHQVVIRGADGELRRHLDLPLALEAERGRYHDGEWRIHFHVPVFERELGSFASTQPEVQELLAHADLSESHLEVETYTFGVLPERYRALGVTDAVSRELRWTLDVLESRKRA
jgi:hypothetical protein